MLVHQCIPANVTPPGASVSGTLIGHRFGTLIERRQDRDGSKVVNIDEQDRHLELEPTLTEPQDRHLLSAPRASASHMVEGKPAEGRRGSKAHLALDGAEPLPLRPAMPALKAVASEGGADLDVAPKQDAERQPLMPTPGPWCRKNPPNWCSIKLPKSSVRELS